MQKDKTEQSNGVTEINFSGTIMIDQFGREIEISEQIIQGAFEHIKHITSVPIKGR